MIHWDPALIKALEEHEWELTDSRNHHICVTCYAKILVGGSKPLRHKRDCAYARLLKLVRYETTIG
jgi:hypothetical protein